MNKACKQERMKKLKQEHREEYIYLYYSADNNIPSLRLVPYKVKEALCKWKTYYHQKKSEKHIIIKKIITRQ